MTTACAALRNVNDVFTFSPALILTTKQADEIVAVVDQPITESSQHL